MLYLPKRLTLPYTRREIITFGFALYSAIHLLVLGWAWMAHHADAPVFFAALRGIYRQGTSLMTLPFLASLFSRQVVARRPDERELQHERRAGNTALVVVLVCLLLLTGAALGGADGEPMRLSATMLAWCVAVLTQLGLFVYTSADCLFRKFG